MFKNLKILTDKDPLLRKKCEDVDLPLSEEDRKTILEMYEYVKASQEDEIIEKYDIRPGIGIAAPQIGILKNMFAIHLEDNDKVYRYALVNPVLVSYSVQLSFLETGEGCLSVPTDKEGYVYRYKKVTIKAYDALTDKEVTIKANGMLAIALQHELDHLSGILYYDRIDKKEPYKIIKDAHPV